MTLYEQMTSAIESFTETAQWLKEKGLPFVGTIGMIDGAKYTRDHLTIEAAMLIVY